MLLFNMKPVHFCLPGTSTYPDIHNLIDAIFWGHHVLCMYLFQYKRERSKNKYGCFEDSRKHFKMFKQFTWTRKIVI